MRKALITSIAFSLLLIGWQTFASLANQPGLIPSLPELTLSFMELIVDEEFYYSVLATTARGIAGMLISLLAAWAVAWACTQNKWLYELSRPLLAVMRSIPVISFILLALIFLDPEGIPLMIAFLTMFPLLAENLTRGIRSLDPQLSVMARLFRLGSFNRFFQVIYPQLKPYLYSGLSSAAGFGWRAIIMGEVLSQCSFGIGSEMKKAQNFIAVPELMAWTVVAIMISFLFDKGIGLIARGTPPILFRPADQPYDKEKGASVWIEAAQIGYHYGVSDFTYSFKQGGIYGITAPSGSGKTTLLNLIGEVIAPVKGKVSRSWNGGTSFVFQEPELLPQLSAIDNIALPLASFLTKEKARETAKAYLEDMEIGELANRLPHALSYGQQQRVSIARALAFPSPILLMDEPFKGLDKELSQRVMGRIQKRLEKNRNRIVLFTSHNPNELGFLANETIRL